FRAAHHVTGSLVRLAEEKGCALDALPLAAMQAVEPRITAEVFGVLSVEKSVGSRTSFGGTAPDNVRRAAAAAREKLLARSERELNVQGSSELHRQFPSPCGRG